MEVFIAIVVVEPAFPGQCSRFRKGVSREVGIVCDAVEHGLMPVLIALHTSVIVTALAVGATIYTGNVGATESHTVRHTDILRVVLLVGVFLVSWYKGKVWR